MEELIPLTKSDDGEMMVNLRNLHSFLEVKTLYAHWVKRKIKKYDLVEGRDYRLSKMANVGTDANTSWVNEYYATISISKELAMLENNARGKQARQYFIAVEEQFKKDRQDVPRLSATQILIESAKLLDAHESRLSALESKIQSQERVAEEAKQNLMALPGPSVTLKEESTRQLLNERINYYVASMHGKVTHQEAWRMLYAKAVYRLGMHFNFMGNKLDQVEKKGKLDLLYALACEMYPLETNNPQ